VRRWTEGEGSVLPLPGDAIDLALWAATLAGAGAMTALAARRLRRLGGLHRAVLAVCLGSAVLVAAFNFAWIGSHPHFWVPAIPALWIAWGFALEGSRRKAAVAATIAAVLLPYNVLASLRPLRGDTDPKLRRAELLIRAPDGCLVVTAGLDWFDGYARYFGLGSRSVLSLWRLSTDPAYAGDLPSYLAAVESRIDDALAAGRPVLVAGVLDEKFLRGVPWREMEPRGFPLERIQSALAGYPSRPAFAIRGTEYRELAPRATRRAARS
jgi:hypothetical protein